MSAVEVIGVGAAPRNLLSPRFLLSELQIIYGRRRNLAGVGVLGVVPVILARGGRQSAPSTGGGPDFFSSITGNGLFVAFAALTVELPLFLPLAVSAIYGESVAGGGNLGSHCFSLTY